MTIRVTNIDIQGLIQILQRMNEKHQYCDVIADGETNDIALIGIDIKKLDVPPTSGLSLDDLEKLLE